MKTWDAVWLVVKSVPWALVVASAFMCNWDVERRKFGGSWWAFGLGLVGGFLAGVLLRWPELLALLAVAGVVLAVKWRRAVARA